MGYAMSKGVRFARAGTRDDQEGRHFFDRVAAVFSRAALLGVEIVEVVGRHVLAPRLAASSRRLEDLEPRPIPLDSPDASTKHERGLLSTGSRPGTRTFTLVTVLVAAFPGLVSPRHGLRYASEK